MTSTANMTSAAPPSIAQANKEFWDTHSSTSMYDLPWIKDLTSQVRTFLGSELPFLGLTPQTSPRVLDYACAHGTVSQGLLSVPTLPGLTVTGLDIAPSMLDQYRHVMAEQGFSEARFNVVEADLVHEDEDDDAVAAATHPEVAGYDLLVLGMALHHMRDYRLAVRRLASRVKVGGTVVIVDWDYPGTHVDPPAGSLPVANGHGHGHSHGHGHHHGHGHEHKAPTLDEAGLGEHPAVTAGTIAHAGFSRQQMSDVFTAAGCGDFDYFVDPKVINTPFAKTDDSFGGVWRIAFSRAVRKA